MRAAKESVMRELNCARKRHADATAMAVHSTQGNCERIGADGRPVAYGGVSENERGVPKPKHVDALATLWHHGNAQQGWQSRKWELAVHAAPLDGGPSRQALRDGCA